MHQLYILICRAVIIITINFVCRYLLTVGLENGAISLYNCCLATHTQGDGPTHWSSLLSFPPSHAHTSTVKRLQWSPKIKTVPDRRTGGRNGENKGAAAATSVGGHHLELVLASCSTDQCVKLFRIYTPEKHRTSELSRLQV